MYRKHILVVDDEAAILRLFQRAFRRQLEVTTATSGTVANSVEYTMLMARRPSCPLSRSRTSA